MIGSQEAAAHVAVAAAVGHTGVLVDAVVADSAAAAKAAELAVGAVVEVVVAAAVVEAAVAEPVVAAAQRHAVVRFEKQAVAQMDLLQTRL